MLRLLAPFLLLIIILLLFLLAAGAKQGATRSGKCETLARLAETKAGLLCKQKKSVENRSAREIRRINIQKAKIDKKNSKN